MSSLSQQLDKLNSSGAAQYLRYTLHGIEKEGLRISEDGSLSHKPHPAGLGSALTNPTITTDYSEAQLELVTPVFQSTDKAIDYLEELHRFTYSQLEDELIWTASMPCRIEDPEQIPIARFGSSSEGRFKHLYRVGLMHRYGKMMQTISGIHYNFSLPDSFWTALQDIQQDKESLQTFRSAQYFSLIRNFRRYSWLLVYLFGATPALCDTFLAGRPHNLHKLYDHTLYLPYATSLRMSDLGYTTNAQESLNICFNHLPTYTESLERAIHTPYPAYEEIGVRVDGEYRQLSTSVLQIENEYYSDIRPKSVPKEGETALAALKHRGVEYIEVRLTDINPFLPVGIDSTQTRFLDIFLISCLLMPSEELSLNECKAVQNNLQRVILRGREPGLTLQGLDKERPLKQLAEELLEQFQLTATLLDQIHETTEYTASLKLQIAKVDDPQQTPSARVLSALKETGLENSLWALKKSKEHKKRFSASPASQETAEALRAAAEQSIADQQQLERDDTRSFEQYLREEKHIPL